MSKATQSAPVQKTIASKTAKWTATAQKTVAVAELSNICIDSLSTNHLEGKKTCKKMKIFYPNRKNIFTDMPNLERFGTIWHDVCRERERERERETK